MLYKTANKSLNVSEDTELLNTLVMYRPLINNLNK